MGFFDSGWFWFIEGVLATVFILGIKAWMEDRGIPRNWWKWLALVLWILLAGFSIAFVGLSIGEREMTAAFRGGILLGTITIVSGVLVWRILNRGGPEKKSK